MSGFDKISIANCVLFVPANVFVGPFRSFNIVEMYEAASVPLRSFIDFPTLPKSKKQDENSPCTSIGLTFFVYSSYPREVVREG